MATENLIYDMRLTKRENDVMHLLINGFSVKMIAAELNLSYCTVDTYVRRIYAKLDVHCRAAAIVSYQKMVYNGGS